MSDSFSQQLLKDRGCLILTGVGHLARFSPGGLPVPDEVVVMNPIFSGWRKNIEPDWMNEVFRAQGLKAYCVLVDRDDANVPLLWERVGSAMRLQAAKYHKEENGGVLAMWCHPNGQVLLAAMDQANSRRRGRSGNTARILREELMGWDGSRVAEHTVEHLGYEISTNIPSLNLLMIFFAQLPTAREQAELRKTVPDVPPRPAKRF